MPIQKDAGRQDVLCAMVDIALADLQTGVTLGAVNFPFNATVLSGQLVTTEAFNSTTSDVMSVGDSTTPTRYLSAGNIRALGARVPLVPTGYLGDGKDITVQWVSGGGVPTTGKVRLEVLYVIKGRFNATQG